MAITVARSDFETDSHPRGMDLTVDAGGHLHVRRWNGSGYDSIAVYAPGQWTSAQVEEKQG